jgi:hypothetical protein
METPSNLRSSSSRVWLFALSMAVNVPGQACAQSTTQSRAQNSQHATEPRLNCSDPQALARFRAAPPRIYQTPKSAGECTESSDCGTRPHATTMLCRPGDHCYPVCEDHWGDCNGDYRDGCEQAIADARYCPGDPRLNPAEPPGVVFKHEGDTKGPGRFNAEDVDRALIERNEALNKCYGAALQSDPRLHGSVVYDVTLGAAGKVVRVEKVEADFDSRAADQCVGRTLDAIDFKCDLGADSVSFRYRLLFSDGKPLSRSRTAETTEVRSH